MFNETVPLEKLSSIKVLFTTEKNSYGIVVNRFMDGEADEIDVKIATHAAISVKLIKHMYLNTTRQSYNILILKSLIIFRGWLCSYFYYFKILY